MSVNWPEYGPVLLQAIVDQMHEPALVLDMRHRVVWTNLAAEHLLGPEFEAGTEILMQDAWPGWVMPADLTGEQPLVLGQGSDRRDYLLSVSPLVQRGGEGDHIGWLLLLHAQTGSAVGRTQTEMDEPPAADSANQTAELIADLRRRIDEYQRLESELSKENRELLSVQSATALVASSLDVQFILDNVTWEMARLLKVERCAIYDWTPDLDRVTRIAEYTSRELPVLVEAFDPADYPTRARALAEKFTWQSAVDQPALDPTEQAYMHGAGIKTLLILPLVFQERVVGLIELSDTRSQRAFTDREISLAQMLSTQIAGAIENARLFRRSEEELARRLEAEEQLRTSLREKEVLLKEIHHRVKNNLQTVSSILNLQSRTITDPAVLTIFRDSQTRVRTMALIHEKLYRSDDLNQINFTEYGHNLATYLLRSYQIPSRPVRLEMEPTDVSLSIDSAVPCGLIINELVTNSLKYAFPDYPAGARNEIRISLVRMDGQHLRLTVADNGVGFPPDLDFRQTDSLGLRLVNILVDQLGGTIALSGREGTCFEITFPAQTSPSI